MRKIKFEKEEESRANMVWLLAEYMGGDADTEHFKEYKLPFPYSEYQNHVQEIEEIVKRYEIIKDLTDGSAGTQEHEYKDLKKEYGKEIADMYSNVPNDPQCDFQFKTSLQNVTLLGYDEVCNKYKAYLL